MLILQLLLFILTIGVHDTWGAIVAPLFRASGYLEKRSDTETQVLSNTVIQYLANSKSHQRHH